MGLYMEQLRRLLCKDYFSPEHHPNYRFHAFGLGQYS